MDFNNESPDEFRRRQAAFWTDHPRRERAERRRDSIVTLISVTLAASGSYGGTMLFRDQFERDPSFPELFVLGLVVAVASFAVANRLIPEAK